MQHDLCFVRDEDAYWLLSKKDEVDVEDLNLTYLCFQSFQVD